ncbi:hypothetical protein J437_LFUL012128 [Ladona fulva]|uniref:Uncharacterized protein n=1 Tax=Ladona fulva TaxID=123851 RepID=A0A8K0KBI6_LADFU|nr:hypothetical protein J437_LFUL012128 [Ladona fulva]
MRQAAACSVLKCLLGRKLNTLTCNQFYQLAALMKDEEPFVREKFIRKFTAKMMLEYPNKSLPLGLLGFYMLIDENNSESISEISILFSRRLRAFTNFKTATLVPENFETDNHVLAYGLLVTAKSKHFNNCQSLEQLQRIKRQMMIFMNAISITQDDFLFYQHQIKLVKNHAIEGADRDTNLKLWTVCDLAFAIAKAKTNINQMTSKEEATLPTRFFVALPKKNNQKYLKKSMLAQLLPAKQSKGDSDTESIESKEEEEMVEEEKVEVVGDGEMTMDGEQDDESIGKPRRTMHEDSDFQGEEEMVPRKRRRRAGRLRRRI